jgi:hypothetical protein
MVASLAVALQLAAAAALPSAPLAAADTGLVPDAVVVSVAAPDTLPVAGPAVVATRVGITPAPADAGDGARVMHALPPAVQLSDAYYTRLRIHRLMSYAMVPLFIGSYLSGDQLLEKGRDAPTWARRTHPAFATGSAVVFGVNQVTGWWNLIEGWKEKEGRTSRVLHSVAMTIATAGFVYAGSIGEEARDNGDTRNRHRAVALGSMGISAASWLFQLFRN